MLLAELEVRHSRATAPTRRVALGRLWLPTEPAPGFGGILLAGIVAAGASALEGDDDVLDGIDSLLADIERGARIVQPRIRHRFQVDAVGLDRSVHSLVGEGEAVSLDIDGHGAPLPQVLAAFYAAGQLSYSARPGVFRLLRRATRWTGGIDDKLVDYLTGDEAASLRRGLPGDEGWALQVLGFASAGEPSRGAIQKRFRELVMAAHPDRGGDADGAGQRIQDLTEAKRILLTGP